MAEGILVTLRGKRYLQLFELLKTPCGVHTAPRIMAQCFVSWEASLRKASFSSCVSLLVLVCSAEVLGSYFAGLWQVRGRFLAGFWQVLGRFLAGSWQILGRFSAGSWHCVS